MSDMADWIPVLSQVKSLGQVMTGDSEGARQTQENFSKQCPIVSQVRSAVEAGMGDNEAATETQLEFAQTVSSVVDCVPGVGHIKGGIHYACGDKDGGDNAIRAASRSVGGAGGFLVGGSVGAVVGGIAGAAAMDELTSRMNSEIDDECRPARNVDPDDLPDRCNYCQELCEALENGRCASCGMLLVPNKEK